MNDTFWLMQGNCVEKLAELRDNSVDVMVTDPPYDLTTNGSKKGFMEALWDGTGIAFSSTVWKEALRVLKPGAWAFVFGATRTYHRMASAVENAGFDIRDTIHWTYIQGFPKSQNLALAIDKDAGVQGHRGKRFALAGGDLPTPNGVERHQPITDEAKEWDGWGTALRATHELILVARKPFDGTLVENIRQHGTGALNIDAARNGDGMWPTNSIFSCICETACLDECPYVKMGVDPNRINRSFPVFKMVPKPLGEERKETKHPTLKPVGLMKWLLDLSSRPGSVVLDPFMGSGTTGVAAVQGKRFFVGMELTEEFFKDAERRIGEVENG